MGSKSDAPDTPDYLSAALAQGQLGKEASLSQTGLNRPNEVTPYGTRTWTRTAGTGGSGGVGNPNQQTPILPTSTTNTTTDPYGGRVMSSTGGGAASVRSTPNIYGAAGAAGNAASASGKPSYKEYLDAGGSQGEQERKLASILDASNASIVNPGEWTVETRLSPEQQKIYDQQTQNSLYSGGLASQAMQRYGQQGAINLNPNVRKMNATTTQLDKFSGAPVDAGNLELDRFSGSNVGMNDLGYDKNSFSSERQAVEDAVFNRSSRMLDPMYTQQEESIRNRLANQGLMEGSEAYNRELENFNRGKSNAYQNAVDSAVLAGGQEQSRLLGDLLASRQNDLTNQQARFNSQLQTNQVNNAATGTEFDKNLQGGLANFTTGLQANQANNQTAQNQFQQGMQSQQANSQYDLQLMQALLAARGQGFNEMQALNQGTTIQQPQFGNYGMAGGYNAPDITGAMGNQYNAQLGAVNAQNAETQTNTTAGASILSAALIAY